MPYDAELQKIYYDRNPEAYLKRSREYYHKNRDAILQKKRDQYANNHNGGNKK